MSDVRFSVFSEHPFIDLNLYQYGYERCDPLHSYGPAIRNHYLFHYVISGKGKLWIREKDGSNTEYLIKNGEGFLIYPGQITTYTADIDDPWEYAWIEFDGLIVKEAMMLAGLNRNDPIFTPNNLEAASKLEETLLSLSYPSVESDYKKIGELYLFIDYLTKSSANKRILTGQRLSDFYIKEITNFIEQHFHESITVEEMASHLNLSRGYLNKIFKKYTGKTPKEYLTNYRMAKATELLKTTKLPIGEVGLAVGYSNQLHFSRAFKNFFGIPPKEYRRQNNQLNEIKVKSNQKKT